ncbi:hypothetical protein Hanom_Chr09g00811191 [Helianthus anomalus]
MQKTVSNIHECIWRKKANLFLSPSFVTFPIYIYIYISYCICCFYAKKSKIGFRNPLIVFKTQRREDGRWPESVASTQTCPPGGSSPSLPNQAAKAKTVQVWSQEEMGLVSNPDSCWLPIQRDGVGAWVQVWDRRRLDMSSEPGCVWYPRQPTGSPTTPRPPPPPQHTFVHHP